MEHIFQHQLDTSRQTLSVTTAGDVVGERVGVLRQAFLELLEVPEVRLGGWRLLKLDLTGVGKMDSLGLDLCLTILREVQWRNAKLQVTVGNADIHRSLIFMGLDQQMDLKLVPAG